MKHASWTRGLAAAALSLTLAGAASATELSFGKSDSPSRKGRIAVGLTQDQRLVLFRTENPARWRDVGPITGFAGDTRLVGMDYRPANGVLYALGNAGGVYTIDTETAVATLRVNLTAALAGTNFDVDFNPAVDRMRVVSDSGQNLRVNVDTGATTVDPDLNNGAAPPALVSGVSGAAYTNNDADPSTNTTLFDVNAAADQVVIQSPANAGAAVATGSLGIDASADVGFDIYSRLDDGIVKGLTAYLVTSVAGKNGMDNNVYRVRLLTGVAEKTGKLKTPSPVFDLAIPTDSTVIPAP
jgi:hypothetical protein